MLPKSVTDCSSNAQALAAVKHDEQLLAGVDETCFAVVQSKSSEFDVRITISWFADSITSLSDVCAIEIADEFGLELLTLELFWNSSITKLLIKLN